MRAVVQLVKRAKVSVENETVGSISKGFLVFLAVEKGDSTEDLTYLAEKVLDLRIFKDENGKMNLSLQQTKAELLLISQFTLCGDLRRGRRPSFTNAAEPDIASSLYERFAEAIRVRGIDVQMGVFGAYMEVELTNDGPVTILLDSRKNF